MKDQIVDSSVVATPENVEQLPATPVSFADQVAGFMGRGTSAQLAANLEIEKARASAVPAPSTWARTMPLELLRESPTNPRKRWGDLDELVKSIAKNGIMMPLIVRPIPGSKIVEIVCGSRRFRAGKQAGVTDFPVDVRDLSDEHVLEFQIVENLQRKDLHPMEEAEGYEAMMAAGYEVQTIADRVGKSTGWIYSRRQLLNLTPEARSAMFRKPEEPGHLALSVALVLGRQPHANQGKALLGLERIETARAQIVYLQNSFARNLKGAPFDLKDGTLPRLCASDGLGDCTSCPNNSNNAPRELFVDYEKIEKVGVCSDTPCFAARADAIVERTAEKARARGETVLTMAQTKRVISFGTPVHGSPFVNSRDVITDDPKRRTWEQFFKDHELDKDERPKVTLAPNDQKLGEVFHLYDRSEAISKAAELGAKWAKKQAPEEKQVAASKAKRKASDDKARLIAETVDQAFPQLIAKWIKVPALPELRAAAGAAIEGLDAEQLEVIAGGFEVKTKIEPWIERVASARELTVLILAALLYPRWQTGADELEPELKACAKSSGVDLAEIGRAQLAAAKLADQPLVKWKRVEGGEEATIDGKIYGVSYNGGGKSAGYFYKGPTGSGAACDSIEAGKLKLLELAGIAPKLVKPTKSKAVKS